MSAASALMVRSTSSRSVSVMRASCHAPEGADTRLQRFAVTHQAPPMILDRFRVDGQVALVTGAGKGIGAGCAIGLSEVGADVVLASRTANDLETVAGAGGGRGRRA